MLEAILVSSKQDQARFLQSGKQWLGGVDGASSENNRQMYIFLTKKKRCVFEDTKVSSSSNILIILVLFFSLSVQLLFRVGNPLLEQMASE